MTDRGHLSTLLVRFEAEYRLTNDEIPATRDPATIGQAVQDAVGASGVVVVEVTDWAETP